ncbi:MAG: DNA2/NAM7 family helicase [Ottowia sp.]|nr:DNA2/NAM7 family helicase [Ottowia sp.]
MRKLKQIKDCAFLTYYDDGDQQAYRAAASELYLPAPELQEWFKTKPGTRFIALDEYRQMAGKEKEWQLLSFLDALGIKRRASLNIDAEKAGGNLFEEVVEFATEFERRSWYKGYNHKYQEYIIDGCKEVIERITVTCDSGASFLLWKTLIGLVESKGAPSDWLTRKYIWIYYGKDREKTGYQSSDAKLLKQTAWLLNRDGEFVQPGKLTKSSLAEGYDTWSEAARSLMEFLGVEDEDSVYAKLPDSVRKELELAKKIMEALGGDVDEADLLETLQKVKENRAKKQAVAQARKERQASEAVEPQADRGADAELFEILQNDAEDVDAPEVDGAGTGGGALSAATRPRSELADGETSAAITRIVRRVKATPHNAEGTSSIEEAEDDDADQDEYTPRAVDYEQRIRREESRGAANVQRIVCLSELQKRAQAAEKYSFAWFKVLLEMECLNSEEQDGSKEISISFAKVEREPEAQRTLVLTHPNRYIPPAVEELDYFPLVLYMADGEEKKLIVEAASAKSSDKLHVKLKSASDIGKTDFSSVQEATISVKSPAFLIKALREQFEALELEDDFDMRASLCENIEFVFGPPGTGKTTHLARNVLLPLMQDGADCKVLVLAPTNKAADVLTHRIMEVAGDADSYRQWLVRFGTTPDEKSGLASVYKDRAFDILTQRRSVVVTTVARFAYDGFTQANGKPYLRNIEWDYIVIDEASMIPIANIIYPLYKQTPQKFIIAGDPFQIEPITSAALWKDENIYTMVGLNTEDSFKNPQTEPHRYKVERLETQYRSIPEIGQVFSNFAYSGILQHSRTSANQKQLNLDGSGIKALNIIKFPVSRYEGIYRAKRLQGGSPYQIYAALFTYEYVLHLARKIARHNPEGSFKIGVIAPYRAQADLIDRLLASAQLPKEVQVQADTIHGFQGDECDIIFAVFNTPPTISTSKGMFLNKRNIINVAISRARDYLFIVMPDDETEGIENLKLVKRVESLAKGTDACAEFAASRLEEVMFEDAGYLDRNTFFTSHQSVNVYGLPEHRYEVRAEDSAVDIQVHHRAQRAHS